VPEIRQSRARLGQQAPSIHPSRLDLLRGAMRAIT
jgi:hypothetical protein